MNRLRTTVKTPGDMVRRALSNSKAAATLIAEARDSVPRGTALYERLDFERRCHLNRARDYARLAADLDAAAAARRRKRAA